MNSGIKTFFEYLPESVKFYKLQKEGLAKIIFAIVLFCQLAGNYIQYTALNLISSEDIDRVYSVFLAGVAPYDGDINLPSEKTVNVLIVVLITALLVKLLSNLFLSVYMYSYLAEKRGKESGIKASFKGMFRHMWRLIFYNIIFGIMFFIGSMFFVIPGIIAYVVFVFGYCYILDLKLNVSEAMTASSEITKGKKAQITNVLVGFFILFELPIILLFSGSSLQASCLASFFNTISAMILQRQIVQLYLDLEYKKELGTK
jgi:hypothetical protein